MDGRTRTLVVQADVRVEVDGLPAHLTGSGRDLQLSTDAPARLWTEFTRAELPSGWGRVNGPRAIGRIADQLAGQGLSLSVVGPTGEVVRLGDRVSSRLGRVATGSAAVHFGSPRTLAPTVVEVVRHGGAGLFDRLRRRLRR
ncbi:hypothetical protein [Nakamurella deserti]|uniref:hypothetical protein n=1 Tax=Nakamurella deserti TaxID=2164074 RepID=UPI000DBE3154|nr:hypothetical protein [Nakamurella deserti]